MIDSPETVAHPLARANTPVNRAAARRGTVPALQAGERAVKPAKLAVLIVHEDLPTGLRAKQVLDRLRRELGCNLHLVVKLWNFSTLRDPLLQRQAVRDASEAQIVFISMHGHAELPVTLCDLLNRWLAAKEETPGALVVSLDASIQNSESTKDVLDCLRTKAAAGGVDLFTHFGAVPKPAWNWSSLGEAARDSSQERSDMDEDTRILEPFSKWSLHDEDRTGKSTDRRSPLDQTEQ
jgi:hypothetical protein